MPSFYIYWAIVIGIDSRATVSVNDWCQYRISISILLPTCNNLDIEVSRTSASLESEISSNSSEGVMSTCCSAVVHNNLMSEILNWCLKEDVMVCTIMHCIWYVTRFFFSHRECNSINVRLIQCKAYLRKRLLVTQCIVVQTKKLSLIDDLTFFYI